MNKNFLVLDFTRLNKNIVFKFKDKFYINKIETDSNNNQEIIDDILNLIKGTNIKTKEKFDVLVNLGPGSFSGIRISLAVAKGIKLIKKVNLFGFNSFILNAAPYLEKYETVFSILKINKKFYFLKYIEGKKNDISQITEFQNKEKLNEKSVIVISSEMKNEDIFKNIAEKHRVIEDFDVKNNIEILIKKNLIENNLIKPVYLG
jgi:tRNA A37 threonylcarbamoyladenosine modification protein TsaB